MDPEMFAIMVFFLLMTVVIGGMVLLFPLTRRLGLFLESRIKDKTGLPEATLSELRRLAAVVEGLELQVRSVSDRQEFVEKILDSRARDPLLPSGKHTDPPPA